MGTAVLFPQDCLRSRSRLKHQTPGMIYPLTSTPRHKRCRPASSQSLEAGLLPLPAHTRISFPMDVARRGHDSKQMKARKVSDGREDNPPPSTISPNCSVYRILQRSKLGDSAAELHANFVMLDKSGLTKGVRESQVEASGGLCRFDHSTSTQSGALGIEMNAHKLKHRGLQSRVVKSSDAGSCARKALAAQKKGLGRSAEGLHSASAEGFKHSTLQVGESRLKYVVEEKSREPSSVRVAAKSIMVKGVGNNDICMKAMVGQQGEEPDNFLPQSLAQLRRTATEPPMTKHIVGRYTNKVMHISVSNPKLEAHANCHRLCETGVTLCCDERWAGPAYSSSPPPSSLPFPKLCLPQTKVTNVELPPLVKQYSASVYMESFLEPSAPTVVACGNTGTWDVAFATKSLRRLLNLDPSNN